MSNAIRWNQLGHDDAIVSQLNGGPSSHLAEQLRIYPRFDVRHDSAHRDLLPGPGYRTPSDPSPPGGEVEAITRIYDVMPESYWQGLTGEERSSLDNAWDRGHGEVTVVVYRPVILTFAGTFIPPDHVWNVGVLEVEVAATASTCE